MKIFKSYFQSIRRVVKCIERLDKGETCFSIWFLENALEYLCWEVEQNKSLTYSTITRAGYPYRWCDDAIVYLTQNDNLIIYFPIKDSLWHIYRVTK